MSSLHSNTGTVKLEDFGYNADIEQAWKAINTDDFELGRVVAEHKERYMVKTEKGEMEAEIIGNMRFTARSREDFPAVGDWVALRTYNDEMALIQKILPRFSILKRKAVDQRGEAQVIATNIDCAFIVQAVSRDFNINRLERYLILCNSSGIEPVIVLTKIDLVDKEDLEGLLEGIRRRIKQVRVLCISNLTQDGYEAILAIIEKGKTYCMLGSSGVGKSTLINNLSGKALMQTGSISESTSKGRHVTTHRELVVLNDGGILIDNPGMREVGIADTGGGLEITFDMITELAENCRFKDCTHTSEVGCAVLEAVEQGVLNDAEYENYMKMKREKMHYESTVSERKQREKQFGKILKNYKKGHWKG